MGVKNMKVLNDNYLIRKEGIHTSNKRFISLSDLHYGVLQQLFYKSIKKGSRETCIYTTSTSFRIIW